MKRVFKRFLREFFGVFRDIGRAVGGDIADMYYELRRWYRLMLYLRVNKKALKTGRIESFNWDEASLKKVPVYPAFSMEIETRRVYIQLNDRSQTEFRLLHKPTLELANLLIKLLKRRRILHNFQIDEIMDMIKRMDRDWYEELK